LQREYASHRMNWMIVLRDLCRILPAMKLRPRSPSPLKTRQARELRREATLAERRVWDLLRNRRMLGLKFRRQHVVAGFIVDFYCAELRLVLELDGLGHNTPSQADYDVARAICLESRGVRVVRLKNADVSENALRLLLANLTCRSPSPRSGEGVRG